MYKCSHAWIRNTYSFLQKSFWFCDYQKHFSLWREYNRYLHSRCLEEVTECYTTKCKYGPRLSMSARKAGTYFKVASGSYLVEAPRLLVPLSVQFFHIFFVGFVFAFAFASEAKTLYPPQVHKPTVFILFSDLYLPLQWTGQRVRGWGSELELASPLFSTGSSVLGLL